MNLFFLTGLFALYLGFCSADLTEQKHARQFSGCPLPSGSLFDIRCARRREECFSSFLFSDSCKERLACRFKTLTLGPIWDNGVEGICTRKPRTSRLCKDSCAGSRPRTRCYLHAMVEEGDIYDINIPSSDRFYTTCKCYEKCFHTLVWTLVTRTKESSELRTRQALSISESPSPSASLPLFTTCTC